MIARRMIASTGVKWTETSQDFWAAVKQSHASGESCLIELLPIVVSSLGPSITYAQFRAAAIATKSASVKSSGLQALLASPSKEGLRNRLDDCFANAVDTATYMDGSRAPKPIEDNGEIELLQATLDAMTMSANKRRAL